MAKPGQVDLPRCPACAGVFKPLDLDPGGETEHADDIWRYPVAVCVMGHRFFVTGLVDEQGGRTRGVLGGRAKS